MTRTLWLTLALLTGCAAGEDVQAPPAPPPTRQSTPVAPRRATPATVTVTQAVADPVAPSLALLTPKQVLLAAAAARKRADGYVGWPDSNQGNIERMTGLVAAMDSAVAGMRHAEVKGTYPALEVSLTRRAVRDLQVFLDTKND